MGGVTGENDRAEEIPSALLRGICFPSVWEKDKVKVPVDGRFRELMTPTGQWTGCVSRAKPQRGWEERLALTLEPGGLGWGWEGPGLGWGPLAGTWTS